MTPPFAALQFFPDPSGMSVSDAMDLPLPRGPATTIILAYVTRRSRGQRPLAYPVADLAACAGPER